MIGSLDAKPQSTKNSIVMQPKAFFSFAKVLSLNRFVDQEVVKVGFFFEASVGAMEVAMWLLVWLVKDEHSVQAEFVRVLEMDAVANLGEVGNPAHAECGGFRKVLPLRPRQGHCPCHADKRKIRQSRFSACF